MSNTKFVSGFEKTAISKATLMRAAAKAEERAYSAAKAMESPGKTGPEKEALRKYMLKKHRNQEGIEAGLVRRFLKQHSPAKAKKPSSPPTTTQSAPILRQQAGHA